MGGTKYQGSDASMPAETTAEEQTAPAVTQQGYFELSAEAECSLGQSRGWACQSGTPSTSSARAIWTCGSPGYIRPFFVPRDSCRALPPQARVAVVRTEHVRAGAYGKCDPLAARVVRHAQRPTGKPSAAYGIRRLRCAECQEGARRGLVSGSPCATWCGLTQSTCIPGCAPASASCQHAPRPSAMWTPS